MSFRDWFRTRVQDEITGSKVLVCTLGTEINPLADADAAVYRRYYPSSETTTVATLADLDHVITQHPDILHLFCSITSSGDITDKIGGYMLGNDLMERCCDHQVKLLWIERVSKIGSASR
jgi:hypothetical protein